VIRKIAVNLGNEGYIETVWGRGYVLRDPEGDGEVFAPQLGKQAVVR